MRKMLPAIMKRMAGHPSSLSRPGFMPHYRDSDTSS